MCVKCHALVDESSSQALGAQNNKQHSGHPGHMSSEACHGVLSIGCLWQPGSPDAALVVGFFPFSSQQTDTWDC